MPCFGSASAVAASSQEAAAKAAAALVPEGAIVGVGSTARRFAAAPRRWLALFTLLALALWALSGLLAHLKPAYFAGLLLIALHFGWQIATLKPTNPADCLHKFKANGHIGWLLLIAICVGRAL